MDDNIYSRRLNYQDAVADRDYLQRSGYPDAWIDDQPDAYVVMYS